MTYCFYLAPQVPDEARRLFAAAAANAGISSGGVSNIGSHRINAIAWFLAREWGMDALEATLRESLERHYEPTWNSARGEFTWQLGLDEEYPRGQYNAFLAAGEAVSEGAWSDLCAAPLPAQPGLVEGVDFPTVALAEARWQRDVLHLRLQPQNAESAGSPTQFRVVGLPDPARWRVEGDGRARVQAGDVVIETTVGDRRLELVRSG